MLADSSPDIPRDARPTGDGRFLYRFRGRDYVLTQDQALHLGRLSRNSGRMMGALAMIPILALFLALEFLGNEILDRVGLPWQMAAMAVLFVPVLLSLLGFSRRIAAALDGCDYRDVPKAEGIAARWVQKLEYDRSISQGSGRAPRRLLIVGVSVLCFVILLASIAGSPHTETVAVAVMEAFSLGPEAAKVIGLILIMSATALFFHVIGRNTPDDRLGIRWGARPTDGGCFLVRFRGRDYVLTREQTLRHRRPFWDYPIAYSVVFLIAFANLFPEITPATVIALKVGAVAVILVWLLGHYWRKAVRLKGCDYREVPKAKGIVARSVQWLEYYRSIYLRDDPSPFLLFFYCLAAPGLFWLLTLSSGESLSNLEGLEFAINAGVMIAALAACLVLFAVPFYALCRAIAGNGAGTSGSDNPPSP